MENRIITEEMLERLRASLEKKMSPKRYFHTVEVEKMAVRLGELYLPAKIPELRAAALLHDITKEYPTERQIALCAQHGISVPREELYAPKTFHARTAAALIPEQYGELASDEVVSAVRWHTTGNGNMTLMEKLIYLADYIDMSRTFDDCVLLREKFFSEPLEDMNIEERLLHLDRILVLSFDMTIRNLLCEGTPISVDTINARNALVSDIIKRAR